LEGGVGGRQVEGFGVERSPDPTEIVPVFGVAGVTDGLEEFRVARHSAAVLRGTGPLTVETHRMLQGLRNILHRLHHDLVVPSVAEVVFVEEPGPGLEEFGNDRGVFVDRVLITVVVFIERLKPLSGDLEAVEVAVPPPHSRLENGMERGQTYGPRNLQTPPNRRLLLQERDPQCDSRLA
jgi:hypothetical protein